MINRVHLTPKQKKKAEECKEKITSAFKRRFPKSSAELQDFFFKNFVEKVTFFKGHKFSKIDVPGIGEPKTFEFRLIQAAYGEINFVDIKKLEAQQLEHLENIEKIAKQAYIRYNLK